MHWKRFKALPKEEKQNEAYYLIGLDIGNDSSGIAFFNMSENAPEVIDLSGGYGRPSVPTVMQYVAETKEWVFGEYALLNRGMGAEITLSALIERLGSHEYVDLDHRPVSVVTLLGLFIKEMISNVKNINPRAEIVGIVAAVPSYFSEQAREEFSRAIKSAGYEKELIALVSDRECVFAEYYRTHTPQEERALLLDYGSREVRGGLYHIIPQGSTVAVKSMSSLFDDAIGTAKINDAVFEMFTGFYTDNTHTVPHSLKQPVQEQLQSFAWQHKDILFQKNIRVKPAKLYFNFAYPPFQQTIAYELVEKLVRPYHKQFNRFIQEVLEKTLYEDVEINAGDVNRVLCVGGGFEMLWAREAVAALFGRAQAQYYKNAKIVTAEGAATVAALLTDATEGYVISVEDRHQLHTDIGLTAEGGKFIPLVERNAFWWQKHPARLLIFKNACGAEPPELELSAREANGETRKLSSVRLDGLPERPKGVTRLRVQLRFASNTDLTATFTDCGFGELFPRVAYEREYTVNIS